MEQIRTLTAFGGSAGTGEYLQLARNLGGELASRDITTVYGGGAVGMMGNLADGALAAGGSVIGVIPQFMADAGLAHPKVTDMRIVPNMHTRKALMYDLADAFIAMPGGVGTLDECFEVLAWTQLGLLAKPLAFLGVDYWSPLLGFLTTGVKAGFVRELDRDGIIVVDDTVTALTRLYEWTAPEPKNTHPGTENGKGRSS
ncbi:MAG: TIGR00730 family Rossman fold protein [Varibaculum sp.]|nr:TIGR00730 family Rossman fold protein [Varibaculum sp.]